MVAQDKAAQAAVLGKRHPTPNLSFPIWFAPNSFEANQIGKREQIIFCFIHKAAVVPRLLSTMERLFGGRLQRLE